MKTPVVLQSTARREFDEAADWYEQRRIGRGEMFSTAVRTALSHISEYPEFYAKVFEDVREAPVSDYPYCVYYRLESDRVVVIAVFHTARDPSVWQGRA